MRWLRALGLAGALVVASVVNLFFAPQIYEPRPPVFSGPDMAESEAWEGHAFSTQPWWLEANLPDATFLHLKRGVPEGAGEGAREVGIFFDERSVAYFAPDFDTSSFPLDLTGYDLQDDLAPYLQLSAQVRCRPTPQADPPGLCDYFVAWDGSGDQGVPSTLVGVVTRSESGEEEVGLVDVALLESLLGVAVETLPTSGESR